MTQLLQKIIYPIPSICSETELFYRTNDIVEIKEGIVFLTKGKRLSFSTYFNSFSITKWLKYTYIDNVKLLISFKGSINVRLVHLYNKDYSLHEDTIKKENLNSTGSECILDFDKMKSDGIFSFEIESKSESTIIYDIGYITEINKKPRELNFAIGICTYKREEFLKRNLESLSSYIICNKNSILHNHLHVYIADNGQTLTKNEIERNNFIHLYPNKNCGGVGGFTRTMIEALFNSSNQYDYIILMDDDIVLDCRVLERTKILLSLLKPEFYQSMLGGALLSLECKNIQVENGGFYDKCKHINYGNLNLNVIESIILNNSKCNVNHNGWFYCCIPTSFINERNLPLPIFIHYDDIEYGLRDKFEFLLMNGICVWHPSTIGKDPLWMHYYNTRNQMIMDSGISLNMSLLSILKNVIKSCVVNCTRYRYEQFIISMQAYNDFYQGPNVFKEIDPVLLHKRLIYKYKYDWFELKHNISIEAPNYNKKLWYIRGVINYFLPTVKKECFTNNGNEYCNNFMVKNIIVYDQYNNKAYRLTKNYFQLLKCVRFMISTISLILFKHIKVWKQWNKSYGEFASLPFWKRYVEIE